MGDVNIAFEICDEVPAGFEEKLFGRGVYFEGGCASFKIESVSADKTFLVGKYSQTFVDEMIRQISAEITSEFSLRTFEGSSVEIILAFAPSTYMEHVFSGLLALPGLFTYSGHQLSFHMHLSFQFLFYSLF